MKAASAFLTKSSKQRSLTYITSRAIKSAPRFNPEEDTNKINAFNGDLAAYFEDLMRRRPQSAGGYINLPKENFKAMVERAANEKDLATLVNAQVNYLGHRNILPNAYVDAMLLKALELGKPEAMLEVLSLHSELLYHPSTQVIQSYLDFFLAAPYDPAFKAFFKAVRGNYLLSKPQGFHAKIIDHAYANNDLKTVGHAYLDILDYAAAGLTSAHLLKVFESFEYASRVDHAMFEQVVAVGAKLDLLAQPTIKLHQAAYYVQIKGYLTAVDLINEAATLKGEPIGKSELLKKYLFEPIFAAEPAIDADVKSQLVTAIKGMPAGSWEERAFYGIEEHLEEKKPEEPVATPDAAAEQQTPSENANASQ